MVSQTVKFSLHAFNVHYGQFSALRGLNLDILANEIFTVIGPANSGKTTFPNSLNRLIDLVPVSRCSGEIKLDGSRYPPQSGSRSLAPQGRHRICLAAAAAHFNF